MSLSSWDTKARAHSSRCSKASSALRRARTSILREPIPLSTLLFAIRFRLPRARDARAGLHCHPDQGRDQDREVRLPDECFGNSQRSRDGMYRIRVAVTDDGEGCKAEVV